MSFLIYFFLIFLLIFINYFSTKYSVLLKYTGNIHQNYTNSDQVPLTGGVILTIFLMLKLFFLNQLLFFFIILFFILGLFADYNFPKKPILRFFLQIFLCLFFVLYFKMSILSVSIDFFDLFLSNIYFN